MSLTQKQEAFVLALIAGKSQRAAYKEAYPKFKGSDSTADVTACLMLKNPKVAQRLAELQGKIIAEAEEQAVMGAVDVLRELESIANDDIANYLDFRTEKKVVGKDGNGNPIAAYSTVFDLKDSRQIDTRNIAEISVGANGAFKIKMYSRLDALEKLGKHLGMFTDKLQLSGEVKLDDARARLAEKLNQNSQ